MSLPFRKATAAELKLDDVFKYGRKTVQVTAVTKGKDLVDVTFVAIRRDGSPQGEVQWTTFQDHNAVSIRQRPSEAVMERITNQSEEDTKMATAPKTARKPAAKPKSAAKPKATTAAKPKGESTRRKVTDEQVNKAIELRLAGQPWSKVQEAVGFNGAQLRPYMREKGAKGIEAAGGGGKVRRAPGATSDKSATGAKKAAKPAAKRATKAKVDPSPQA